MIVLAGAAGKLQADFGAEPVSAKLKLASRKGPPHGGGNSSETRRRLFLTVVTKNSPECSWAMQKQMIKPRPVPLRRVSCYRNGSKTRLGFLDAGAGSSHKTIPRSDRARLDGERATDVGDSHGRRLRCDDVEKD